MRSEKGGHSSLRRSRASVWRRFRREPVDQLSGNALGPRVPHVEGQLVRELFDSSTESRPGKPRRLFSFLEINSMQVSSDCGSLFGERASERPRKRLRRLAVNQFGPSPMRRFESCRSHRHKRVGGIGAPSTPNGLGTGLLSRAESVRARPTAPRRGGHKL